MDKTTKILLVACFILVGALAFTTGMLINIQKEIPIPIQGNKTNTTNKTSIAGNSTGVSNTPEQSTEESLGERSGSGHHIVGPVYYVYDDEITHDWVAWYYDVDTGEYFSEYEHWDPKAGCYHD
ncbi:MAG: hypothetical protein H5T39_00045 [Methanobacteriales archaeon]|nr:hypothetical protein [Methanobacteriaceae archaeon]MBC7096074.1 hypothetical protein [Methanobacteriales archaeon]